VRSLETIKELLSLGVARVVLGTKAVEDSEFLEEALRKFKDAIIVSVDAKSGHILTKGWQSSVESVQVLEFAQRLKKIGFSRMIYTDITKDGMLKGPNIEDVAKLLKKVKIGIIASGGVSSVADVTRFKTMEKDGLQGVIVGKALYEGKFTLLQALQLCAGKGS
jgi:phosphoribosylformimino-5-aminoimidazole carboxamide ribotide isomerase